MRRFATAISFFFVTMRLHSRFYLPGERGARPMAVGCSVASLLFGWWGLPWGPIYTVQSLVTNLRGGARTTVLELARSGTELRE